PLSGCDRMSASGMSAMRLVDGAGNGIGNNGGVPAGSSECWVDGAAALI
ncbi:hypothetical protein Tco_0961704, partial [Tanacetum coccineum]